MFEYALLLLLHPSEPCSSFRRARCRGVGRVALPWTTRDTPAGRAGRRSLARDWRAWLALRLA